MALLGKEAILLADDRKFEIVHVPEWGGDVRLRSLSGRERDEFESSTMKLKNGKQEQDMDNFRARFVALCIVDEDGKRIFVTKSEIGILGSKSVSALQRLFNKASEMNGMSEDDVEAMAGDFGEADQEPPTSD